MSSFKCLSTIKILIFLFVIPALAFSQQHKSDTTENHVDIYKKPGCMCCDKWADYLKEKGFSVDLTPTDTLATIKENNHVTNDLRSCHTAFIDGYVIEGHVPVESVNKLLENRPDVVGITVPGMPSGTPGMGMDGTPYEVLLFDENGEKSVYGEF